MILTLKQMSAVFIVSVFLGSVIVWGLKVTTVVEDAGEDIMVGETAGGGIMVEASHYPLKLTMVLNKTTFKVGEPINITFITENIGNETLTMIFSDGSDHFSFIVYDENGSKVYEPQRGYLMVRIPTLVSPGLAGVAQDTWYQQYNPIFRGWDEDPLFEYKKVPPGKYQIVGVFVSSLSFTIQTPPTMITIVS